jgi:parallel beta-helix repeat protein
MNVFGAADDTAVLQRAINGCRPGGIMRLEPRTYLVSSLRLRSDCTYSGAPGKTVLKLVAPNQFIFDVSERTTVRITGIRFDGSGIGGAIVARENGPATGITVEMCDFTGVSRIAIFPANVAVVSTWALIDSAIRNNVFSDVAAGIWLTTVQNVSIENNTFRRITQGNAVYIGPNPVPFPSGKNLRITGNRGSELARMGIEIFRPDPPNGSSLDAPLIEGNEFSDWTSARDGFGLSITHGDGAVIRNNVVRSAGPAQQYLGIEVIVKNAVVEDNRVEGGFSYGIAVQGTAAPHITGNRIDSASDTGIILACDNARHRCASHDAVIAGNSITNARRVGIALDNDWAGSRITNNTISRAGGDWPGDNTVSFAGIHQVAASGPGTIESNTIVQTAPAPPKGFDFCGVNVTSPIAGSLIGANIVRSDSTYPLGTGILDSNGSALGVWNISKNRFLNLARDKSPRP